MRLNTSTAMTTTAVAALVSPFSGRRFSQTHTNTRRSPHFFAHREKGKEESAGLVGLWKTLATIGLGWREVGGSGRPECVPPGDSC